MRELHIDGFARAEFAPIADVFAREMTRMTAGGAGLTVMKHGEVLVDLRGGDYVGGPSRQQLFSVSKIFTAAASLHAADRGEFNLDAPLAAIWPEFDRDGVRTITPRMVLSHSSGLVGVSRDLPFDELVSGGYERELAERGEPCWEPGADQGYHAWSFGALIDGALRRATGSGVAAWIGGVLNPAAGSRLQLAEPGASAGAASLVVGDIVPTPLQAAWRTHPMRCGDALAAGTLANIATFNRPAMMEANWPAANVIGASIDIARALAVIINGALLRPDTIAAMTRVASAGVDRVLGIPVRYGLGVQLPSAHLPFLGPGSFGHEGAGGALAAASVARGLAIGFASNHLIGVKGASDAIQSLLPALRHCSDEGEKH